MSTHPRYSNEWHNARRQRIADAIAKRINPSSNSSHSELSDYDRELRGRQRELIEKVKPKPRRRFFRRTAT